MEAGSRYERSESRTLQRLPQQSQQQQQLGRDANASAHTPEQRGGNATTGRTRGSIFISAECSSFFNSGFSHVVMTTRRVGVNGRQEVETVSASPEEVTDAGISISSETAAVVQQPAPPSKPCGNT